MAGIDEFRAYTNTPARRHTFYCYCTKEFVQDQAIFFILVEAYRASRRKRQAAFLKDWFIDGNIPDALQDGGYLGIVNISDTLQNTVRANTNNAISAVGLTFRDKVKTHGFFGAIGKKLGDTSISGNLFDAPQNQVVTMLDETGKHGFGGVGGAGAKYQPDSAYQPLGAFANQMPLLRKHLKTAGFDPDDIGLY